VAAKPEPAKEAARTEPAKAEPAKPDPNAVVPNRRDAGAVAPKHTMRDRIKSVKDRLEKALQERKKKREEAIAVANAKRTADAKAEASATFPAQTISAPAPAAPAPAPTPAAAPTTPAPKSQIVAPNQPGAISLGGDDMMMVSKDRGQKVAAASLAVPAAAVADFKCPPGMQKIPGGTASIGSDASDDLRNFGDRSVSKVDLKSYCIDQYEFPNQPGVLPKVAAPFTEAEALCKNAGKRLCSEDEWEAACRGPQNLRFPYGTRYDADACNTSDAKDNPRKTSVAGAFTRCKSGYGVFDLSGNAAEWTASSFDSGGFDKTVKGGHAARPGFDDRCASRRKLNPGARAVSVGFRCCADAH
jgi:formylglycine-generating enzyme required for sulfatase activity